MESRISDIIGYFFILDLFTITPKFGWNFRLIENSTLTYFGRSAFCGVLKLFTLIFYIDSTEVTVTKWIKSCLLQCFGTFKMPILMFISVLVFRPEGQI